MWLAVLLQVGGITNHLLLLVLWKKSFDGISFAYNTVKCQISLTDGQWTALPACRSDPCANR
jgi:hypothetical protein